MTLSEILISKNIVSKEDFLEFEKQARKENIPIEDVLLKNGIDEDIITATKSEVLNIPFKKIKELNISSEILRYIPKETSMFYKFIPLSFEEGVLNIGMVYPDDLAAREALRFIVSKSNIPFKIFLISNSDFIEVMKGDKNIGGEAGQILGEFESSSVGQKETFSGLNDDFTFNQEMKTNLNDANNLNQETKTNLNKETKNNDKIELTEEAPIVKMVGIIIRHAIEGNASDIHIEPLQKKLRVRFRLDGVLYTSLFLPLSVHNAIISRIKILTNMMLDEKRKPQDGRFSVKLGNREIDFRVSTLPTHFGEKVAIRILDPEKKISSLEGVGVTGRNLEVVNRALEKPYGLILITGPTGSGKSTTLYSMLQKLNTEDMNIISLEDPIEYKIEGLNQSQVRPEIGYDFADGLRSILRQDPDIIMVGEIRDKETAALAVHAALTGHLVLSTLHTNTAVGAIPRLIDMGVDPYLISPTLILVISQRLVRTLCGDSREEIIVDDLARKMLEKETKDVPLQVKDNFKIPDKIYRAKPSALCPNGTKGRIGIFEMLEMNKKIEEIILTSPSVQSLEKEARNQGMITLREDGILKVFEGKIGIEELSEVIVGNNIEI